MHIHYLQHVAFEKPGFIAEWADQNGYRITGTHLFENTALPSPQTIDLLVVMGGPMSIYDETNYPWLKKEKRFIDNCIDAGKKVLGICLGAQLIADNLGANVSTMPQKEIGWYPLQWTEEARKDSLFPFLPSQQQVLHWHGDMFEMPVGSVPIAHTKICANQGFLIGHQILGLQFHLEMTPEGLKTLIENSAHELVDSPYIQNVKEILQEKHFASCKKVMKQLLDQFTCPDKDG